MSTPETTRTTGWVGWIWFAGLMLVMLGAFNIIQGFAAIFTDDVFVPTQGGGVILDVTGWGWTHLIIGLLALLAGFGLFSGATWARIFAVIVVMLNAIRAARVAELPPGVERHRDHPGRIDHLGADRPRQRTSRDPILIE